MTTPTPFDAWLAKALELAEDCIAHAQCEMRDEEGYPTAFRPDLPAARAALSAHLQEVPMGEPVAEIKPYSASVRMDWCSVQAAHNAKPGFLYRHPKEQT